MVLLKLECRLEGGERIDHLVPAVEHVAVIQALSVSCGQKKNKNNNNTKTLRRERTSGNEAGRP